jgi:hypothetical protein
VFLENHIIRAEDEGGGGPVQLVHNDFTSGYKAELIEVPAPDAARERCRRSLAPPYSLQTACERSQGALI